MKAKALSALFIAVMVGITLISSDKQHKQKPSDNIFAPDEWVFMQRSFPYGKIDEVAQSEAVRMALAERVLLKGKNSLNDWEFAGPVNLGGRITDIEVPAGSENTVYLGAASGGIFKSYDRGANWFPVFDGKPAIAIGDLAISPADTNVIYAGTGEPNAGGGSLAYDGKGIFKSADGGQTWQNLGLSNCGSTGRIAIDPLNPSRIFVASMGKLFANSPERGIFRSTNGGATWQKVLYVSDSTGGIDVVLNPQNPDIVYAALWERIRRPNRRVYGGPTSAIYRSTNGGTTWTKLVNGLPTQQMGRISLAICAGAPSNLYACIVGKNERMMDLYKSMDGGDYWTATNTAAQIYTTYYDWWFGGVKVDPVNPDEVYLLMMDAYRSMSGGTGHDWLGIASMAHVDQHALYLSPSNPQYRILGNDGGVNFTTDNFQNYTGIYEQNLPVGQFYCLDVFPGGSEPNYLIGGLQDNGVAMKSDIPPQPWQLVLSGDGVMSKFDPIDPQSFYGSYQYGGFEFYNPLYSYYSPAGFIAGDRFNWKSPLAIFKKHPQTLFIGSNRVYKSSNYGYTVTPISNDLTNGNGSSSVMYGTVTALAVAPSDSETVYAGTDDANLWRTRNGGSSWTAINTGMPQRWVTSIKVAETDPLDVLVTYSGYRFNDSIAHVYHSADGGSSWTSISGNLPDIPVNDILRDPDYANILYLATDVGVYDSKDTGLTWQLLGSALPLVPVNELAIHPASRYLYAATYGRSMYRYDLSGITGIRYPTTDKLTLNIYPNPVVEEFTISFTADRNQPTVLYVYDILGTLLRKENIGHLNQGRNSIRLNRLDGRGNRLMPGSYLFRLVSGDKEGVGKAVVL